MAIKGYKSFDVDHTNCYGQEFTPGTKYHVEGQIIYGVHGNGIHFAKNLEDTIRYSGQEYGLKDVAIAEVIGDGIIVEGYDHYNGYYDLYCCSDLEVVKFLTREEIISHALTLNEFAMERFVSQFRLESEEIDLFKGKSIRVDNALEYYQRGNKDIYSGNKTLGKRI